MQTLGTDPLFSDHFYSSSGDPQASGLKSITSQINSLLNTHKSVSYDFLLKNITNHNRNTLKRRVYDVLTVLKALGICKKVKKKFVLNDLENQFEPENDTNGTLAARRRILIKKETLKNLKNIKDSLEFVVDRNTHMVAKETLHSPFVIVLTDKRAHVNCETNEESTYYRMCSKSPLNVMDDLTVFQELYKHFGKANGNFRPLLFTDYTFDDYTI